MAARKRAVPLAFAGVVLFLFLGTIVFRFFPEPPVAASHPSRAASMALSIPARITELKPAAPAVRKLTVKWYTLRPELNRFADLRQEGPQRIAVEGDTPFQRRLVAGLEFRRLRDDFDRAWRNVLKDRVGASDQGIGLSADLEGLSSKQLDDLSSSLRPVRRNVQGLLHHLLRLERSSAS